ncbi:ABC amino acid transporter, periplasmic ligand binding protein [Caballeronia hypogeia]|uniref:ABC amino acid transporter, periplasmic ligand binding protein n=1 Tax=Caballeronia hypogeia TaxID=1777140 RepID=A0A158CC02_9BURK|nr:ABC transporter substrate-binding protein [Caballeronia hypogeia]SAK79830.1 ABC amino acid transporter, periplasmic ligand binding protein [Caballeronia hypogeia]
MFVDKSLIDTFAPDGKLRASINLGNPVLANRPDAQVLPTGISVDLARKLAEKLSVELELVVFNTARDSVEAVASERADIGFFAVDPARGAAIAFTEPYLLIEGFYLVRHDSPFKDNADVDREGVRIAVGKGTAYDLFLSREIKSATLVRAASSQVVVETFLSDELDVAAGVKQVLEQELKRSPNLRLLDKRFMVIQQAMGLPKSKGEPAARFLREFVEEMKSTGFIDEAMRNHRVDGATLAPSASSNK